MSNSVSNAPCNAVTNGVRNGTCTWVQNQNQNQIVFKAVCGSFGDRSHSFVTARTQRTKPLSPLVVGASFMNEFNR